MTAATGLLAHGYGPAIGGLFLAFPAILPTSLTLVRQHEGRRHAVELARGARLGTTGMFAFAGAVLWTAGAWSPPVVLGTAAVAWCVVNAVVWGIAEHGTTRRGD